MSAAEQNVAAFTANADLFAEVRRHNLAVINHRRLGGDWDAPENQYRNGWLKLDSAHLTATIRSVGGVGR